MPALWILIGVVTRIGSAAGLLYLLLNGRWLVLVGAFAFTFISMAATALANVPMRIFFSELAYPEALSTPGLIVLISPWRRLLVLRIPQLFYGGLVYLLGLVAFRLFGDSTYGWERAALMITAYDAAFTVPTRISEMMSAQDPARALVLSSELFHGKIAFLVLLFAHAATRLDFWAGAALFALAMFLLHLAFEIAAFRRPLTDVTRGSAATV